MKYWGSIKDELSDWHIFAKIPKIIFKIKPSTNTIMVNGELDFIPPSFDAHIKILCYHIRLRNLPREKSIRRAFDCFMSLHNQGSNT